MYVSRKKYMSRTIAWTQLLRYAAFATFLVITTTYLFRSKQKPYKSRTHPLPALEHLPPYDYNADTDRHPVDFLIHNAQKTQAGLLAKQSHTLKDTARRYRDRRGRHPPPGFEAWYEYAQQHDAIIIEDFWDRIYHDLKPFWAVPAAEVKVNANTFVQLIRVRDGTTSFSSDNPNHAPLLKLWRSLVDEAAPYLPDLDMPINFMNEPRVLVPWDTINKFAALEDSRRKMPPAAQITTKFRGLADVDAFSGPPYNPNWIENDAWRYWEHARQSCAPDSPSRNIAAMQDFAKPVLFPLGPAPYSYRGYVQNWTEAQDPCLQPHLRNMHGTFVESISMSTTHELIPVFSGSKLSMNNDILIPGSSYLLGEDHSSGAAWHKKSDSLVWRGVALGGRNHDFNWHHFHRHRFVQSLNGSTIDDIEQTGQPAKTFDLPMAGEYELEALKEGSLAQFVDKHTDVAFVDLACFPPEYDALGQKSSSCSYTRSSYKVKRGMSRRQQLSHKFVPDIDGDTYSSQLRSLLHSTSVPLKATIYKEWHDDRLVPWVHFVPFDNSYRDIYGVLDYFLHGHDVAAHRIAMQGKDWAERVLRREDMVLYVWRLLLEFARVCDDKRDYLGYVDDILAESHGDAYA